MRSPTRRANAGPPASRTSTGTPAASTRPNGFALIAALWLLVALSAVALDASLRSRERRLATANVLDRTRAREAALAGAEYARSRLTTALLGRAEEVREEALESARSGRQRRRVMRRSLDRLFRSADPFEDPWRVPQELVRSEMAFGAAAYTLRLRDVGSALNLNEADEGMLRQFFARGLGLDYALADRITQAVLDWRDEDRIPRVNGGEREQYLDEGLPVLPADRLFAEVEELRHVMGVTPEIFEAARPYLTLLGSGDINLNAAPREVLLAAPGITEAAADELLRLRESGRLPRRMGDLAEVLSTSAIRPIIRDVRRFRRATTYTTDEVEIVSEGRVRGGPVKVRAQVVVSRSDTGAVVVWRKVG